jgi:hypothetical protein
MKCAAVIVDNRGSVREAIEAHQRFLPDHWRMIHVGDVFIEHQHDYSRLLGSLRFWQRLKWDKILIFQTDSGLLRHGIEEFLEWDYVGAPWTFQEKGGNGGLSLRTRDVMIACLQHKPYDLCVHGNEDVYFCNHIEEVGGRVAPRDVCSRFSVESIFQLGTLGYHGIHHFYPPDVIAQIKNQYLTTETAAAAAT